MSYLETIPELTPYLKNKNFVDIKSIEGDMTLREFIARFINYQPAWVDFLFRVRGVFVRFLGMTQEGIPHSPGIKPEEISMTPGAKLSFFTVECGKEDQFLVAGGKDSHLDAYLTIAAQPLDNNRKRFYVVTTVQYNNWAGPIYFNVIRPFHHLIVNVSLRAAIKTT